MKKRTSLAATIAALSLLASAAASGQTTLSRPTPATPRPAQRPAAATPGVPPQDDADDVVRITTNLVQLDVIVTDGDGRPVTDLRPEEFEVFEDGKAREITNFSYVSTAPGAGVGEASAAPPLAPARPAAKGAPPAVVKPLHRRQVRRTIGIVVDTDTADFEHVGAVRRDLRRFIDEQMRPGDLVGIYTTRGGVGALQQFTTDRAQLHKALDRVRWYPPRLAMPEEASHDDAGVVDTKPGNAGGRDRIAESNADFRANTIAGAVRFAVRGMSEAPGRKSLVLFTNAAHFMRGLSGRGNTSATAIDRAVEAANRASVVIYTVDSRGLYNPLFNAQRKGGETVGMSADAQNSPTVLPGAYPDTSPPGFNYTSVGADSPYSKGTGGLFIHSMNNFDKAMSRVLLDQSGYYLVGYRPGEETFRGGRQAFRSVGVRVKRPGVRVRTRSGFYALTDEEARREVRGSDRELYAALAAPVTSGGIYVRLTSRVIPDPAGGGAAARMLLHIDGRDLTFADAPESGGGYKKLVLDVAAVTLSGEGEIMDEFTRTHTVRTGGPLLEQIVAQGLTYTADVPVRKPGTYHLRIVVRDQSSQRLGSASQVIDVPDLRRKRLALSGLSLRELTAGDGAPSEPAPASAEGALAPVASPSDPAVRRFRPGAALAYDLRVFNPTPDPSNGRPRLGAEVRLYRDGQPASAGEAGAPVFDAAGTGASGVVRLAPDAPPGEYVLQLVVTDEPSKDKGARQTSQWIDFEVIK